MKNGFTLVELLAVMIIMGLLIVLSVPGYVEIYSGTKRNNLNGKITEIKSAAKKYGNAIKDKIKKTKDNASAGTDKCETISVDILIRAGLLVSESDTKNVLYNPTDQSPMNDPIKICYCLDKFDIEVYYSYIFKENKVYHENDIISFNNKLYKTIYLYDPRVIATQTTGNNKIGIDALTKDGKRIFQEVTCD